MFVLPHHSTVVSSGSDVRSSLPIPTVYEHIPAVPQRWEYQVLTIETKEAALPDAEILNALGREGWIMVGLLDEGASGHGSKVHYYFARQPQE
jgi:anthranilate phosphoribosyltransferase